jgi:hypothetical protein
VYIWTPAITHDAVATTHDDPVQAGSVRSAADRVIRRAPAWAARYQRPFVAAVALAVILGGMGHAHAKTFWFDELVTVYVARLPTLTAVWTALTHQADNTPMSFYLETRAASAAFGENHIAMRLPAILGFAIMCVATFCFAARRSTALHGMLAMLFPAFTLAREYGYEARSYGVVLGCTAAALAFWQAAAEARPRRWALLGLGVSVLLAATNHIYAGLMICALAVGEAVRSLERRRPDWPVWAVLALPVVGIAAHVPFLRSAWTYSDNFVSKWGWDHIGDFYTHALSPFLFPGIVALLLMLVVTLVFGMTSGPAASTVIPRHEIAALLTMTVTPVLPAVLALWLPVPYVDRYTLYAIIAIGVLVAWLLHAREGVRPVATLTTVAVLTALLFAREGLATRSLAAPGARLAMPAVFEGATGEWPIVVSDPMSFMELTYYAPADLRAQFFYVGDIDSAVRWTTIDSAERTLVAMGTMMPLRVVEYSAFERSHPTFYVYFAGRKVDWILQRLREDGRRVELVSKADASDQMLFLVRSAAG